VSTTTTTLSVPDIHCGNCKSSIEGALGGLAGIEAAEVSVDDRTVTVSYDEAAVGMDRIKETIEEQGFEVAG
jgi:copper chaperone